MNLKKFIFDHWIIILIVTLAGILRFWRLEELTTFGGDQGYDFLIVKRMLVDGDFTLLGPKIGPYNEIGNLYLGPAYYYLIAPFLWFFKLDPIGPAVLTVILSTATILLIYTVATKFLSKSIAILAATLYAFNSFLIDQSRAPSNPHLIPFFAICFIWAILKIIIDNSRSKFWTILAGISLGVVFQLHYLTAILIIFLPALIVFKKARSALLIFACFLVTVSPQILFELRNEFFITNLFLKQLSVGQNIANFERFFENIDLASKQLLQIFISSNQFMPIVIAVLIATNLLHAKTLKALKSLAVFWAVSILGITSVSLYSGNLESHYFALIYPVIAIMISIAFVYFIDLSPNPFLKAMVILVILQVLAINLSHLNLDRGHGYTMPEGWNLKAVKTASKIIAADADPEKKFNIAATLDGDTRARPYRYLVEVYGKIPQGVEFYPQSDLLYLIAKDEEEAIKSYTVWEVATFKPFTIAAQWEIQNGIRLYKLTRSLQ